MSKLDFPRVYAQALDFLKLTETDLPLADLMLTLQAEADQLLTDWPALEDTETTDQADPNATFVTVGNARELRSFERAVGAFAAATYLESPATAAKYLHITMRKIGDNEKRFSGPTAQSPMELAAAARSAGNDALGRIQAVSGTVASMVLAALSGRHEGRSHDTDNVFDQMFGPEDA